jgi:NhaP-type Na+/H+ or K+/H+ antiporter
METFLSQVITVRSFITATAVIFGIMISGTTLYWTTEVREAIEAERNAVQKKEMVVMKAQLNRIETRVIEITTGLQTHTHE